MAQQADIWARVASVVVAVVGLAVVVIPTAGNFAFDEDPFEPAQQVKKVETVAADGKKTLQTTTSPASPSLAERSLGDGGLLLLRIGVVALASFLAGAVVQRTILARFDLKVGGIEIPELTEATDDAIVTLAARIERQEDATTRALLTLAELSRSLAAQESDPDPPTAG